MVLPQLHKTDIYPFYDWNLFSFSPQQQEKVFLKILEIDGNKLDRSIYIFRNRKIFPGSNYFLVPHQINRLGWHLLKNDGNKEKTKLYKKSVERNLFYANKSVVYEIGTSSVNIRKLLKPNYEIHFRSLARFKYKERPAQ